MSCNRGSFNRRAFIAIVAASTLTVRPTRRGLRTWLGNPWGETRVLWVVAIAYVAWTLLPVAEAVLFSFNKGRSITRCRS